MVERKGNVGDRGAVGHKANVAGARCASKRPKSRA
jgi:hypothetical protein